MSDWQKIETAPKDGTAILMFDGPHENARECAYQVLAWSVRDGEWFLCDNGDRAEWEIKGDAYWMPLPEPPK